ncbi:hypothetical protein K432DRAFT_453394 [Lepidopterella palustris CBS 459.81]|uniref:Uncharacterized protein n=1 Tax=Lepidopterella palustris CBS 459.81 TaxID=1314670 RepID=A0A8E2JF31_9PEZI|nr:hypothetical protein K432DRAFT_453394 [Lepidopterella palustris CBS 459.81]
MRFDWSKWIHDSPASTVSSCAAIMVRRGPLSHLSAESVSSWPVGRLESCTAHLSRGSFPQTYGQPPSRH